MSGNEIVITYDYYTLDQAREIIYAEIAENREHRNKKLKQKRKEKLESIKITFCLFCILVVMPIGMILHWFVVGY